MRHTPVIVFGEGSAAVFTVQNLLQRGEQVVWAAGSGAKLLPVMPYVKSELALASLVDSQKFLGEEPFAKPLEKGTFHRVFRNKAFKLPLWKKTPDLDLQDQSLNEMVSPAELPFMGVQEYRIAGLSPAQLEQELREKIETHPHLTRVSSAPVIELEVFEQGGKIQFANGFITEFKQLFYCDSFHELKAIPKLMTVLKHQTGNVKSGSFASAIQVVFTHSEPLLQSFETGLMIPLTRDANDATERHALGYFMEPTKSVWTVFLQPDEVEENHEIMKKLRKLKQALNKAFDSPEFLPEGKKDFMATVQKEQVRFEEAYLATEGKFKPSAANTDFVLLSDSFGFSLALERIAQQFQIAPISMDTHAETLSAEAHLEGFAALPNRDDHAASFDHP